jgi:tyrosine-protein phosphatase SIW14
MARVLFMAAVFLASGLSSLANAQQSIPEFHKVSEQIYRGGRPDQAGLAALVSLGVKTVINLEDDKAAVASEVNVANQLGLKEILMPMSGFLRPKRAEVAEILRMMNDPANQPVFVHCQHGQDRTGVVVGLYRVFYENWNAEASYAEMLQDGFHRVLFLLDHFYKDVSGLDN